MNISARETSVRGRSVWSGTSFGWYWPPGGWRWGILVAIVLAITIIGIPFAWAHLKLAGIALWPIGKIIVPPEDAPIKYPRP